MKKRIPFNWVTLLWVSGLVIGQAIMLNFDHTPGDLANPPIQWPSNSTIQSNPNKPTLLMFVHPQCPCSKASVSELEIIAAHIKEKADIKVLIHQPEMVGSDWNQTDVIKKLKAIPELELIQDKNGIEAERFQIKTSGQTLLYDEKGQLVFKGGITAWRGHVGNNVGRSAIVSLLSGSSEFNEFETSVFGCPLFSSQGGNI